MDAVILDDEIAPALADAPIAFRALGRSASRPCATTRGEMFAGVPLSDAVERTEHVVSDDPHVVVRVHRPKGVDGPLPCLYSIHGGGYILGSLRHGRRQVRPLVRARSRASACRSSTGSRRRRRTPARSTTATPGCGGRYEHADELGIDRDRIGIGGVSAGGGLAAALALLARDRGEVPVAFQLLECPMIDDRQTTSSSRLDGLPIWSRESNTFGWRSYLGDLYGATTSRTYAAAARATDLAGLPPALVIVGGADGFRDEDIDYALRLNQAGVPTELHVLPGAPHGQSQIRFARVGPDGALRGSVRWDGEHRVDDWLVARDSDAWAGGDGDGYFVSARRGRAGYAAIARARTDSVLVEGRLTQGRTCQGELRRDGRGTAFSADATTCRPQPRASVHRAREPSARCLAVGQADLRHARTPPAVPSSLRSVIFPSATDSSVPSEPRITTRGGEFFTATNVVSMVTDAPVLGREERGEPVLRRCTGASFRRRRGAR